MESKTRHIKLILLLFLLSAGTVSGQVLDTLRFSEPKNFDRKEVAIAQLEVENELINVMFDDFDYSVSFSVFDKNSLEESNRFSWKKNAENYAHLEIHVVEYFQEKICILFNYIDIETREEVHTLSIIDSNGAYVDEIELSRSSTKKKYLPIRYYTFKCNSGEILAVSSSKEGYRGIETEVGIHIINADLKLISSNELTLPGSEKIAPPSQFEISNNGTVYFLSGSDKLKAEVDGKLGLEKKVYQLYSYNYKIDKLKQFDVSIAEKYISDVKMKLHKNGDLYVLGFYNNSHEKGAEGVFIMLLDGGSLKVKTSGKKDLSVKIKEDFISSKRLEKNPVIDDLYLDHFFIKENGNIVFIGEVFSVDKRHLSQQRPEITSLTTSVYYHFDEILCVELDSRLNYVQHLTIEKRQRSINEFSIYYSYSVINLDSDEPYIAYNYIKNKNDRNVTEISGNAKTQLILQPLFSEDAEKIETPERLKIAPGINAEFSSSFMALQSRRQYLISHLLFKDPLKED